MGRSLGEMEKHLPKIEVCIRLCAALMLVLTACLVGLDSQTKVVLGYFTKRVTFRDLQALEAAVYIDSVAAAYNLIQLGSAWFKRKPKGSNSRYLPWICYLLDQVAGYIVFAGNSTASQQSLLAVTGSKDFQWTKWCNRYTRFCFQIGGAMASGYIAVAFMAVISAVSSFNLFRLYSPKRFLLVKAS